MKAVAPFLRWIGGKRQIISSLVRFAPKNLPIRVYREPFLGAGSLFFALQPRYAVLSDLNEPLINCYEHLRNNWRLVNSYLKHHAQRSSERYYYQTRTIYNVSGDSAAQAARFIYLNKACFNGIYRVNRTNEFNVPYGWKSAPAIPKPNVLQKVSEALRKAKLLCAPYDRALSSAQQGDFIYLDPPYPPLNGTAYFTHYTQDRFKHGDQSLLAELVRLLDRRGCLVMMSNADVPAIRQLYRGFRMISLDSRRYVTCKAERHLVKELIITNY